MGNSKSCYEEHLRQILIDLNIEKIPNFIYGKEMIIEHCKNQSVFTKGQIECLEKEIPHGLFLWIEDYTVCIEDKDCKKIGTLAHELKHVNQYQKKPHEFRTDRYSLPERYSFFGTIIRYFYIKEIGANWYALKYCFKNKVYGGFWKYALILFAQLVLAILLVCFIFE